jgi:hypothetical protein
MRLTHLDVFEFFNTGRLRSGQMRNRLPQSI